MSFTNLRFKKSLAGLIAGAAMMIPTTGAFANTTSQSYTVKSGDTLSKIAKSFDTTISDLAKNNDISNVNLIYANQKLTIDSTSSASTNTSAASTTASTASSTSSTASTTASSASTTQTTSTAASTSTTSDSANNSYAARRRQIESGNNYNTFTGNGYLGAYQFSASTWAAGVAAVGGSTSDFSAAHQDAVATWYANERYGGWQNVPTTGGW